jgi:hypothetical protein
MISILFLAADPTDGPRLRLGEEVREIQENLRRARLGDQFEFHPRFSVRPSDISQALLDVNPRVVHFSGHGTSAGALYIENRTGQIHPIQPDALAALFEIFASEVNCVVLNACYSITQAQAIVKHIPYVIGMSEVIGDRAAVAFSDGFYQALGAGRSIEEAYKLGCVQIRLEGIPEHLIPVLLKSGVATNNAGQTIPHRIIREPRTATPVVRPPAVARPFNLGFDGLFEGDLPLGWFNSLGFVDYVSTAYESTIVARPDGGSGMCVLFRNPQARNDEFGSLMQRCPAHHLAGRLIRFEGEIRTRNIEQWAGLWLRVDGDREFNLFFDNMSNRPIHGSTPWTKYSIDAHLPREATWLNYGIVLEGGGVMWADNFRVLVWGDGTWIDA